MLESMYEPEIFHKHDMSLRKAFDFIGQKRFHFKTDKACQCRGCLQRVFPTRHGAIYNCQLASLDRYFLNNRADETWGRCRKLIEI